jgi:SAM-dependent methyltransferase
MLSPELAAMRLLLLHRDVARTLHALADATPAQAPAATLLAALLRDRAEAAAMVVAIADRADEVVRDPDEHAVERCSRFFDWAVRACPEASVALYSFGDGAALASAAAEVIELLERRGVIDGDRDVLDVGCGIGRIEFALAGRIRSVTGVDVSAAMIAEARRRCAMVREASFSVTGGRDLRQFIDRSFGSVIAVDTFPYLYQAGDFKLARICFGEMVRVLRPGGDIVILNLSYRSDTALDRSDAERFALDHGLELCCASQPELRLWDGRTFHWRLPS